MQDDSLRCRLEALNRGPLPPPNRPGEGGSAAGIQTRATATAVTPRRDARTSYSHPCQAGSAGPRVMPGLLRRGGVVQNSAGQHLQLRLPLDEFWTGGERLVTARQQYLKELLNSAKYAFEPPLEREAEFAALVDALPDRALLLDLETCGLAGAALFLAGLLRQIDGRPTIELLLARNYAEEAAVLQSLWQIVAVHDVLMTFNGKSFDWPMVRERTVRHRLQTGDRERPLLHVDLLHHARRQWRRHLPDCRLQTLERYVCRRVRTGDIPGHRIPAVYAEFVRTGFQRDMDAVLYHNALDLVTLLDLALRLAG